MRHTIDRFEMGFYGLAMELDLTMLSSRKSATHYLIAFQLLVYRANRL